MDAQTFIDTHGVDVVVAGMGTHTQVYPGTDGPGKHMWAAWSLGWRYTDEQGHERLLVTQWDTSPTMPEPEGDVLAEALYDLLDSASEGGWPFDAFLNEHNDRHEPGALYRDWIHAVQLRHRVLEWLAYEPVRSLDPADAKTAAARRKAFFEMSRDDEGK